MAKNPLRRNKRAQGMTEYIIIVGLVAIAIITAVNLFGEQVNTGFTNSTNKVKDSVITKIDGGH